MKPFFLISIISLGVSSLLFSQKTATIKNARINPYDQHIQYMQPADGQKITLRKAEKWLTSTLSSNEKLKFSPARIEKDPLGFTHICFQQSYDGILIEDAVYIVHAENGKITSANGEYCSNGLFDATGEIITKEKAIEIAKNSIQNNIGYWNDALCEAPKLVYLTKNGTNYSLAYKTDIYSVKPLTRKYIYVNAYDGSILEERDRIYHDDVEGTALTKYNGVQIITTDSFAGGFRLNESGRGNGINTYDMNNGTNYNTAIEITDDDNFWDDTLNQANAAYDAHYGAEATYDYFLSEFGRNSYDNNGGAINSYVHYGNNVINAFWDGSSVTYGDGNGNSYLALTSLDIVGHEITHALTQYTAGLIYRDESGALNESFSDIFGVVIDFYKNPATANYLIADQITNGSNPFRNMKNPNQYGHPDTYKGNLWYTGSGDNGGIHSNSGVQNYWFYLLAEGDSGINDLGDTFKVNGIGISSAAAIAYRNLTTYLTPNSDYEDARFYSIQAAIDLFGTCSPEVNATVSAWYAVGIGNDYTDDVVADFNTEEPIYCRAPATIAFLNTSQYADSFVWDFGDDSISFEKNPNHLYADTGTYLVTLIAAGSPVCGSTKYIDTIVQTIRVSNEGPIATSCYPEATAPNNTKVGIRNVLFHDLDNSSNMTIEAGGYEDFTCSHKVEIDAGRRYYLQVTTGFPEYHDVKAWIDFNNDGDFNNQNELVLISEDGFVYHSVSLLISDSSVKNVPLRMRIGAEYYTHNINSACDQPVQGQFEDYTVIIKEGPALPPIANFSMSKHIIELSDSIELTDLSEHLPTQWHWSFPGAIIDSSNQQNPTVKYAKSGVYEIRLIAENAYGKDTLSEIIQVVNEEHLLCFSDSSNATSGVLYDDGGPNNSYSNDQNCSFLIHPPCGQNIILHVKSLEFGNDDFLRIFDGFDTTGRELFSANRYTDLSENDSILSISNAVFIHFTSNYFSTRSGFEITWSTDTITKANFEADETNFCSLPATVSFTNLSYNAATYHWDFGDDSSSTDQNPMHSYTNPGSYTVSLKVTSPACISPTRIDSMEIEQYITVINRSTPKPLICFDSIYSTNPTSSYGITSFDFNSIQHESDDRLIGYEDYTCVHQTNLMQGTFYPITIHTQSTRLTLVKAWIDFNNNGNFEENSELLFSKQTSNQLIEDTIYIPSNAVLDSALRLRIRSTSFQNVDDLVCAPLTDGQVEDYTVIIKSAIDTSPVANFIVGKYIMTVADTLFLFDQSSYVPTSWQWSFPGATPDTSSLQYPQVRYDSGGVYSIQLTVENSFGKDSILKTEIIEVFDAVHNMCDSPNISTALSGLLYDSGGPDDFFGFSETCDFLIDLPCDYSITLHFDDFYLGNYATLYVYDGVDENAPLLISASGDNIPKDIISSSSSLYFVFSSSFSRTRGFEASWRATNMLQANFKAADTVFCAAPALVEFTNLSLSADSFIWSFGDGTHSTERSPTHLYQDTGSYSVTLISESPDCAIDKKWDTLTRTNYIPIQNNNGPSYNQCIPTQVSPQSFNMGIYEMHFNTIHSESSGGEITGYEDFTCQHQTYLDEGQTYSIDVETSSFYNEDVDVWIDFNNDGLFNRNNEHVFASKNIRRYHSGSISIPAIAEVVNTPLRMRVRSDYRSLSDTSDSACADLDYGQVEDYTVIIQDNVNPPLVAFSADRTAISKGTTIQFTDESLYLPETWHWEFAGGTPTSSDIQNPMVQYNQTGIFEVKLIASNIYGIDSAIYSEYIHVLDEVATLCSGKNQSSAESGTLFDAGGPTAPYSNYENCSFLIQPNCADSIQLTFTSFNIEAGDFITVFDGIDQTAPTLFSGSGNSIPATIISSGDAVFVAFSSNSYTTADGFQLDWNAYNSGVTTTDFTVSHSSISYDSVVIGSTKTKKIALFNPSCEPVTYYIHDKEYFSVDTPFIVVSPGLDSIRITFTPTNRELYTDTLLLTNLTNSKTIIVSGVGYGGSAISVLNDTLPTTRSACEDSISYPVIFFNYGTEMVQYETYLNSDTLSSGIIEAGEKDTLIFKVKTSEILESSITVQSDDPLNANFSIPLNIILDSTPCANFSYTSDSCLGIASFNDLSLLDPFSWEWDFGDSTTSQEQHPTHNYENSGLYTITLNATNTYGTDQISQSVYITKPKAEILFLSDELIPLFPIEMEAISEDVITWGWDFGDGNSDSGTSMVTHQYLKEGEYEVTLTIVQTNGCTLVSRKKINIKQANSIEEKMFTGSITPNPNDGVFLLRMQENSEVETVQILSAQGAIIEVIDARSINTSSLLVDLKDKTSGLYFIKLLDKAGNSSLGKLLVR